MRTRMPNSGGGAGPGLREIGPSSGDLGFLFLNTSAAWATGDSSPALLRLPDPPPAPRTALPLPRPPPVPPRCPRSRPPSTPPPTPTPAPDPTFSDDVVDAVAYKYGWDPDAEVRVCPLDAEGALVGAVRARAGGAAVTLSRASNGAVDWSRPAAPAVEEVVGPDGVDFVAGDGALTFGSGIRDLDMVGLFELVVSDGAGGVLAEFQLAVDECCLTFNFAVASVR